MVKIKSVKVNFIMNMILTASTFIFPLITLPYITRVLAVEGVGKVNIATSIAQYFSMVAMLGVPTYGIRACAQVRDDREKLTRTGTGDSFIESPYFYICVYCIFYCCMAGSEDA